MKTAVFVLVLWVLLCRPTARHLCRWSILGVIMFAPLLTITPWAGGPDQTSLIWPNRLAVTATIALKGITALLVTLSGFSTITLAELPEAVTGIAIPGWMAAVISQIVFQTLSLWSETECIAQALRLRGVTHGIISSAHVAVSLPTVWIVRVLAKAERTANAMTLRGLDSTAFCHRSPATRRPMDRAVLTGAVAIVLLASLLRWGPGA